MRRCSDMQKTIENIQKNRHNYYTQIIKEIETYIYREKRYNLNFSLAAVYAQDESVIEPSKLQDTVRKTDKVIKLSKNLCCIVYDSTNMDNFVKTAENSNKKLQQIYCHKNFFMSAAESNEFNGNYLEMTNSLFERLEYAIENNLYNTVIYEEYII